MEALRAVLRVAVLWVLSLVVAIAGMEAAHRAVVAIDRDRVATSAPAPAPTPAPTTTARYSLAN